MDQNKFHPCGLQQESKNVELGILVVAYMQSTMNRNSSNVHLNV